MLLLERNAAKRELRRRAYCEMPDIGPCGWMFYWNKIINSILLGASPHLPSGFPVTPAPPPSQMAAEPLGNLLLGERLLQQK